MISDALDFLNGIKQNSETTQSLFKLKTNLPLTIRIQQESRVMFLNNSLIEKGICNGTIGVITDFDKDSHSDQVAFCVQNAIVHCWIQQLTSYFMLQGKKLLELSLLYKIHSL